MSSFPESIILVNSKCSDGKNLSVENLKTKTPLSDILHIYKNAQSVVILCSSAKRCIRLISELKSLDSGCKVGKLFAKHLKIKEQAKYLETHRPSLSVGTPNRVLKLVAQGAFEQLQIVAIDSFCDSKNCTILDIKDTRKDLLDFLDLLTSNVHKVAAKLIFI